MASYGRSGNEQAGMETISGGYSNVGHITSYSEPDHDRSALILRYTPSGEIPIFSDIVLILPSGFFQYLNIPENCQKCHEIWSTSV